MSDTRIHQLRYFDLTIIVISLVIGMGIFKTPALVARDSHTPLLFFLAWIVGGLIALCGALTYAEIGSRYPITGGYYRIFAYAYHPAVGFMINSIILISNAISTAGVALIGAEYAVHAFFPVHWQTATSMQMVAIGSIILFFIVNILGLKPSAVIQNLLMVTKLLMMSVLILALFIPARAVQPAGDQVAVHLAFIDSIKALGIALIAVTFSYEGYQQTINFGREVHRPGKTIPRAIITAMLVIIPLYLLMNLAYVRVIGFSRLGHTEAIAGQLASALFGRVGDTLVSLLLFVSVLGYVNVALLSNPRVIFAMSEDGLLPVAFRRQNHEKQTFGYALLLFTLICLLALVLSNQFSVLLNYIIFLDSIGMIFSAATIFVLRRRKQMEPGTAYVMKLYPLLPVVFIVAYAAIAISVAVVDLKSTLISIGLLAGSFMLYLFFRLLERKA